MPRMESDLLNAQRERMRDSDSYARDIAERNAQRQRELKREREEEEERMRQIVRDELRRNR